MGTRSLTFVYEEDSIKALDRNCCMYRQFDGYPSGHGKELYNFLSSGKMVNGYSPTEQRLFNGMECLAAQMIAEFKQGVGNFYLMPTRTKDAIHDYEYHIYFIDKKLRVVVKAPRFEVFNGTLEQFKQFCETEVV